MDLLLGTGCYVLLEGGASGQTLGKRLLGRVPSTVAAGLGYLWMLWDPERQTWHDKLGHSIVIPTRG